MLIQIKQILTAIVVITSMSIYAQPSPRPIPPGCSSLNSNIFCENNIFFIADLNTTNVQLNVSGLGSSIVDVNVFTEISHTFAGDLEIVLISPSGRTVTLSTANGRSNDNVFNGTTWDDDGVEGVTDAVYANLVVKPSLKPEEGLGNFVGDNPNGIWTLSITDDSGIDVGQITSFCLDIASTESPLNLTTNSFSNNTSESILDQATISSTIVVAGLDGFLSDVNLNTFIAHTFPGDLDIILTSPSGSMVVITTDNGATNDNAFNGTIWDDSADDPVTDHLYSIGVLASPLSPENGLGAFTGENPNGIWTLSITDDALGDIGTLSSWNLTLTTGACMPIPTLSEWGLVILLLSMSIIGLVVFYQIQRNSKFINAIK